jgi:chromosome segregation ATPase
MNSGNDSAPVFKKAEMQKLLDEGFDPQEFIDNSKENRDAVASLGIETIDPADIIAEAQKESKMQDSGEDSNQDSGENSMDNSEDALSYNSAKVANNNKFMTIEDQLVKASAEISAVVTERDEIRVAMETLVAKEQTELKELSAKVGELSGALEKVTAENAELLNKIAELQKNQISASAEAAKIASSVGVDPVEISPADAPKKAVSHLEAFLSMPAGAERSAYYAKYKNEIVRGL